MARRIKPAAMASVSEGLPAAGRPVDGYAEAELTKAFEVIRHQAMVLKARSRVAAAALGVTPEELEPQPPLLRVVGSDERAQAALDQREEDLAAREETLARDAASVDDERKRVELLSVELDAQLGSLELGRQALRDAEHAAHARSLAREKELASAEAAVVQREAAVERELRRLEEIRRQLADDRAVVVAE